MMNDSERALAQIACAQLMSRYATAVDSLDMDRLVSVFAEPLVWRRPDTAPMRTHADVRAFFDAVENRRRAGSPLGHRTRHCMTTLSIDVIDENTANGITYALVFRDLSFNGETSSPMPDQPEVLVEYRDKFSRTDAGWRIVEHEAHHIFRSPLLRAALTAADIAALNFAP